MKSEFFLEFVSSQQSGVMSERLGELVVELAESVASVRGLTSQDFVSEACLFVVERFLHVGSEPETYFRQELHRLVVRVGPGPHERTDSGQTTDRWANTVFDGRTPYHEFRQRWEPPRAERRKKFPPSLLVPLSDAEVEELRLIRAERDEIERRQRERNCRKLKEQCEREKQREVRRAELAAEREVRRVRREARVKRKHDKEVERAERKRAKEIVYKGVRYRNIEVFCRAFGKDQATVRPELKKVNRVADKLPDGFMEHRMKTYSITVAGRTWPTVSDFARTVGIAGSITSFIRSLGNYGYDVEKWLNSGINSKHKRTVRAFIDSFAAQVA